MANDRLYIRCTCGGPTAMLAKIWGDGGDAWALAAENLDLFFDAHRGCSPRDYALAFEADVLDLPSVHDRVPEDVHRWNWGGLFVYVVAWCVAIASGIIVGPALDAGRPLTGMQWAGLMVLSAAFALITPALASWGRQEPKP